MDFAFLGLDVAVAGGSLHSVNKDRGVGGDSRPLEAWSGTSGEDFTVLAGPDALVVVLDNQEFGQFVPTLHHHVRVGNGLCGQIFSPVGRSHLLSSLLDLLLILGVEVLKFFLGLLQVTDHGAVAGIYHIRHEVINPEGALGAELVHAVVLPAERVRDAVDPAICRHISDHRSIVHIEICHTTDSVRQPVSHLADHGHSALLAADRPLAEHLSSIAGGVIDGLVTVRRCPRTGADVSGHVKGGALIVVAHVVHYVADRNFLFRLDPEGKMVNLGHISINIRQIAVYLSGVVVVAVETPHTGLAVADGAEVHRAIGLAETEVGVRTVIVTLLLGEGYDVGAIHAITFVSHEESELLVDLLGLRELLDTAGVGLGANAVVRNPHGDPDGALVALAFADDLHDPSLVLVTDGE